MSSTTQISVVIPHLNQLDSLCLCLESLRSQTGEYDLAEVVVVDNGSDEYPGPLCTEHDAILLVDSTPGPGPARNTGIARTSGEILAFIDADCTADTAWLATITSVFSRDGKVSILGGDVRIPRQNKKETTQIEAYESVFAYRMREYISKHGFTGTGNLAVRSSVMKSVGPFGGIEIAEDRDWGQRATAGGYRTCYVPDMIVFHPARSSFAELTRKWDRHMAHDYEKITAKPFGRLRWIALAVAILLSPLAEIPQILRSDRVSTPRERWLAFICLVRIRFYRFWQMPKLLVNRSGKPSSHAWNRDT